MRAFHGCRSHGQTSGAVIPGGAKSLNAKPLRRSVRERGEVLNSVLCASGGLFFLGKDTACEARHLLYVGIGGLIPGGWETQCGGHADELCEGLGPLPLGNILHQRNPEQGLTL
jgi:hypothetical protein